MALDLSGRNDDEVQIAYNTLVRNPERFADNPEYAAAVRAEYGRRFRRPSQAVPDNVDANLDAAAAPVSQDPPLKPRAQQPTYRQRVAQSPRNFSSEEADMLAAESDPIIQDRLEALPNRHERFGRQMNELDARMGWERGHPAKEAPYPELVPGANARPRPAPAPSGPPVEMINGKPYVKIDGAIFPADSPMVDDPGEYTPTDYGYGTMLVDGIQVPITTPADGLLRQPAQYRLGDVEAERHKMADHSRRVASRRRSIEENRTFGSPYLPAASWSREQVGARQERKHGEINRSNMGTSHAQRIRNLAESMNVSEDVAAEAYNNAVNAVGTTDTDRPNISGAASPAVGDDIVGAGYAPGDLLDSRGLLTPAGVGHVMRTAKRDLLRNHGGVDVRREQKEYSRGAVVRSGLARGNPLEYLGRDDVNDWQRMVVAERFLRQPQGMTPLGVDAVGGANAMRMMNADIFAQGMPGAIQAAEARRRADRMDGLRAAAAEGAAGNMFPGSGGREGAERALKRKGASREERREILDDLFGSEDAPSGGTFPGPPPPPPSNPLAAPSRPPGV